VAQSSRSPLETSQISASRAAERDAMRRLCQGRAPHAAGRSRPLTRAAQSTFSSIAAASAAAAYQKTNSIHSYLRASIGEEREAFQPGRWRRRNRDEASAKARRSRRVHPDGTSSTLVMTFEKRTPRRSDQAAEAGQEERLVMNSLKTSRPRRRWPLDAHLAHASLSDASWMLTFTIPRRPGEDPET